MKKPIQINIIIVLIFFLIVLTSCDVTDQDYSDSTINKDIQLSENINMQTDFVKISDIKTQETLHLNAKEYKNIEGFKRGTKKSETTKVSTVLTSQNTFTRGENITNKQQLNTKSDTTPINQQPYYSIKPSPANTFFTETPNRQVARTHPSVKHAPSHSNIVMRATKNSSFKPLRAEPSYKLKWVSTSKSTRVYIKPQHSIVKISTSKHTNQNKIKLIIFNKRKTKETPILDLNVDNKPHVNGGLNQLGLLFLLSLRNINLTNRLVFTPASLKLKKLQRKDNLDQPGRPKRYYIIAIKNQYNQVLQRISELNNDEKDIVLASILELPSVTFSNQLTWLKDINKFIKTSSNHEEGGSCISNNSRNTFNFSKYINNCLAYIKTIPNHFSFKPHPSEIATLLKLYQSQNINIEEYNSLVSIHRFILNKQTGTSSNLPMDNFIQKSFQQPT